MQAWVTLRGGSADRSGVRRIKTCKRPLYIQESKCPCGAGETPEKLEKGAKVPLCGCQHSRTAGPDPALNNRVPATATRMPTTNWNGRRLLELEFFLIPLSQSSLDATG